MSRSGIVSYAVILCRVLEGPRDAALDWGADGPGVVAGVEADAGVEIVIGVPGVVDAGVRRKGLRLTMLADAGVVSVG